MTTTKPTFPAAFLLIAEKALVSGGNDPGAADRLEDMAPYVRDVLTLDNLQQRKKELTSALDEYLQSRAGGRSGVNSKNFAIVANAVEVGLVAGFLIARMLDEREAKR